MVIKGSRKYAQDETKEQTKVEVYNQWFRYKHFFKKKTIALKVEVARKLNWLSKAFIFIDQEVSKKIYKHNLHVK